MIFQSIWHCPTHLALAAPTPHWPCERYNMQQGQLLAGKRGLVMGVANEKSIAWGIAAAAAAQGAEIAFSYQMEGFGKRLKPLADSIGSNLLIECDVAADGTVESCFNQLAKDWPKIDFVVHALAYSDKAELKG